MLICSWVIMKRVWINNACSVLTDATHYHATALVRLVQKYMGINMEVFLESRMLEDLAPDLAKQLSAFVRAKQARKYIPRLALDAHRRQGDGDLGRLARAAGHPAADRALGPPRGVQRLPEAVSAWAGQAREQAVERVGAQQPDAAPDVQRAPSRNGHPRRRGVHDGRA